MPRLPPMPGPTDREGCPGRKAAQAFGEQAGDFQNAHPCAAHVTQTITTGRGSSPPRATDKEDGGQSREAGLPGSRCV